MLSERQRLILNAIVNDYIRSAEPVGSRTISKRGDVNFSPATIRNEMADLEELGFLEQPHTSAGRIPSHKGYRYYVDHLLEYGTLSKHELNVLKSFFMNKIQQMEDAIQHVAIILSNLTNYTSIVLGPELFAASLKHLQLVPLNERSAVAILVTNTGHVNNKLVEIPENVPFSEIEKAVNLLNAKLQNTPMVRLRAQLYKEVAGEMQKYVDGYEELLRMLDRLLEADDGVPVYMSGTSNMLTQPEFKDVDKVKEILDFLEETPLVVQQITSIPEGIHVRIGKENSVEAINNCSLITATYSVDGVAIGTIGILGPTRMEYGKVLALLDRFSKDLALAFEKWYK